MLEKDLTKKYEELSATEKIQANCDLKATNIILQGLPSDVYLLVNHHIVAKDLWEKFNYKCKRRQSLFAAGTSGTRANISRTGGNNSGQQRVVKCFNCQGKGHMARQYPKPKRKRDAIWFRDKVLSVEAQGSSKVLNEDELAFLADPRVTEGSVTQTVITHNVAYQVDDLDAYDFDCDEISTAKAYLYETQNATVHDTNSPAQQVAMILSVFERLLNQVTNYNKVNKDNLIANESLSAELERYKERVKLLEERQNFCGMKEIKKEFSVARTPQQNGNAKRKNMTLIEAARTMLADSLLPILF
nr:ribonuclease H-like domain-containing protein [Tanacetum cinerariifolium]